MSGISCTALTQCTSFATAGVWRAQTDYRKHNKISYSQRPPQAAYDNGREGLCSSRQTTQLRPNSPELCAPRPPNRVRAQYSAYLTLLAKSGYPSLEPLQRS